MTIDPTNLRSSAAQVAQSLAPNHAQSTSASGNSTTTHGTAASTGATISSNDFLSLLVTEMKNQDPTQPTDPNAYIQQLVGVNSLQQLIAINQDLSPSTSSATTSSSAAPTTPAGAV